MRRGALFGSAQDGADSAAMNGRDSMLRHYPALLLTAAIALLAGCASGPRTGPSAQPDVEASSPVPMQVPRTGAPVPLDLRADDVLMQAMGLIGTPYRFGGTTPERGFDCSGFTTYVFRESVQLALPRTAQDQFNQAGSAIAKTELVAGDLVFFRQNRRRVDHVGIYVGEGRFVHAPSSGGRVRIDALSSPHWTRSYAGAKRLLD